MVWPWQGSVYRSVIHQGSGSAAVIVLAPLTVPSMDFSQAGNSSYLAFL